MRRVPLLALPPVSPPVSPLAPLLALPLLALALGSCVAKSPPDSPRAVASAPALSVGPASLVAAPGSASSPTEPASPPPPVTPSASPRADQGPDVSLDPNTPIVSGPAGSMRLMPGPSGGTPPPRDPVPFDDVRAGLERARHTMRRCYQQALQRDPSQQGKLAAHLVFDAAGHAARVEMLEQRGFSDELTQCLAGALRQLEIGPGEAGRELTIPFVLLP